MGTEIRGKPHTSPLDGTEAVPLSPDGYATTQEIAALGGGGIATLPDAAALGATITQGAATSLLGTSFDSPGPVRYSQYGTLILGSWDFTVPAGFVGDVGEPFMLTLPDAFPPVAIPQIVGEGRLFVGGDWLLVVMWQTGRTVTFYGIDGATIVANFIEDDAGEGHFSYFATDPTGTEEGQQLFTPTVTQGAGTIVATAEYGTDLNGGMHVARLSVEFTAGTVGDAASIEIDTGLGAFTDQFGFVGPIGWALATLGGVAQVVRLHRIGTNAIGLFDPLTLDAIQTPVDVGDVIEGQIVTPAYISNGLVASGAVTVTQTETIVLSASSAVWVRRDSWVAMGVSFAVDSVTAPSDVIQVAVAGIPGSTDGIDHGIGVLVLGGVPNLVVSSLNSRGSAALYRLDNSLVVDALQAGDSFTMWFFYEANASTVNYLRATVGYGAEEVFRAEGGGEVALFGADGVTSAARPTIDPTGIIAQPELLAVVEVLIAAGLVIDGT